MTRARLSCFAVFAQLAWLLPAGLVAADAEPDGLGVVKQFCELEYAGTQDVARRTQLVKLSADETRKLGSRTWPESPYVVQWQVAPLDVVTRYSVGPIAPGAVLDAAVTYRVIASRDVWNGRLKRVAPRDVEVHLRLVKDGATWKILDPGRPRVSRDFLSQGYRDLFQETPGWYRAASGSQLRWLRDAIDNIILLDDAPETGKGD